MRVSVVLPTYNERENVRSLVPDVLDALERAGVAPEVVVVDDDSPDGTADYLCRTWGSDSRVRVIHRTNAHGLATALRRGIEEAAGDVIVLMDADYSHDPAMLGRLVARMDGADIVNGSRYFPGTPFEASRLAVTLSRIINVYFRWILRLTTQDNTNGFLCFRAGVWKPRELDFIFFSGYGDFQARMFFLARRKGWRFVEIPAGYRRRTRGESKTRFLVHGWGYLWTPIRIRLNALRSQRDR